MTMKPAGERDRGRYGLHDLPGDWNRTSDHPACTKIGDTSVADGAALLLRVPSALVPEERNVLVNRRHPRAGDMAVVSVRPFSFDRPL